MRAGAPGRRSWGLVLRRAGAGQVGVAKRGLPTRPRPIGCRSPRAWFLVPGAVESAKKPARRPPDPATIRAECPRRPSRAGAKGSRRTSPHGLVPRSGSARSRETARPRPHRRSTRSLERVRCSVLGDSKGPSAILGSVRTLPSLRRKAPRASRIGLPGWPGRRLPGSGSLAPAPPRAVGLSRCSRPLSRPPLLPDDIRRRNWTCDFRLRWPRTS